MEVTTKHPVKQIREDYGLTQGELGAIVDVPASFVAQWETGASGVPERVIEALWRTL